MSALFSAGSPPLPSSQAPMVSVYHHLSHAVTATPPHTRLIHALLLTNLKIDIALKYTNVIYISSYTLCLCRAHHNALADSFTTIMSTWVVDVHDSGLEHVARAGDDVGTDGALTKFLKSQGTSTITM